MGIILLMLVATSQPQARMNILKHLVGLLESPETSEHEKILALGVLERYGPAGKAALPALKKIKEDAPPKVRQKAEEVIAEIEK